MSRRQQQKAAAMTPEALELVAARFRVLGEPLRLRLLQQLALGERPVSELAMLLGTSQPNVSKHLKLMQEAGLVTRRADKNTAYYSVADESVFALCEIVCNRLADRLSSQAQALAGRRAR
ncbi:MAG TPA: metalloregulator ArsR/SmtB family transcription factor [Kofleriaceae bacterium]|nr:metalloregulator ArsR/SmtB family transcription factor [Kofleriaceae bacterium]